MAIKELEKRKLKIDGHVYCCRTFDITEEMRELFGVPVKEAFVVLTEHDDMMEEIPKTIDTSDYASPYGGFRFSASATSIDIPTMESIYAVFDDDHIVQFWISEWGGMKRISSKDIDFKKDDKEE